MRPVALGLIVHNDRLLCQECHDSAKDEHYFKPPGGGIQFREHSEEAMRRELWEELSVERCELKLLTVVENIFEYDGEGQHEIVFVYQIDGLAKSFYDQETLFFDEPNHGPQKASWVDIPKLISGELVLFPAGVRNVLTKLVQGRISA